MRVTRVRLEIEEHFFENIFALVVSSYLEHALDGVALGVEDGILGECIRHHLIAADQVLVDNHGAGRMEER